MGILAKIERMYFREKVPLHEIARRTGLSRKKRSECELRILYWICGWYF